MRVTNVTVWVTLHGSAHKAEVEAEEIVDATETAALDAVERSASNAINLDTLHASAKRIKTFAIVATVLDTLLKTVNRSVLLRLELPTRCSYFELGRLLLQRFFGVVVSPVDGSSRSELS